MRLSHVLFVIIDLYFFLPSGVSLELDLSFLNVNCLHSSAHCNLNLPPLLSWNYHLSFSLTSPLFLIQLTPPSILKHSFLFPYMTAYCLDSLHTSLLPGHLFSGFFSSYEHVNGHWIQTQRTWFLFLSLLNLDKWLLPSGLQFMISISTFSFKFL